jgi:hypothetical protein
MFDVMASQTEHRKAEETASKLAAIAARTEIADLEAKVDALKDQNWDLVEKNRAHYVHVEHMDAKITDLAASLDSLESYIPIHEGVTANIRAARSAWSAAIRARSYALEASNASLKAETVEAVESCVAYHKEHNKLVFMNKCKQRVIVNIRAVCKVRNANIKARVAALKAANASLKAQIAAGESATNAGTSDILQSVTHPGTSCYGHNYDEGEDGD